MGHKTDCQNRDTPVAGRATIATATVITTSAMKGGKNSTAAQSSQPLVAPTTGTRAPTPMLSLSSVSGFLFGDYRHHQHHHNKNNHSFKKKDVAGEHCHSDDHLSLERKANRLSAIDFDNRVHTLMSIQRQDRLKVLAYNYLASSSSSSSSFSPSPSQQQQLQAGEFHRLEHDLLYYENVERVELLKLAVWKSQCLLQFPSGKYRSYLDMAEWKELGWMTQKVHVFGSSAELVEAVAVGVLPFLTGQAVVTTTTSTTAVAAGAAGRAAAGDARYGHGSRHNRRNYQQQQHRHHKNGRLSGSASASAAALSGLQNHHPTASAFRVGHDNKRKRGVDGDGEHE
jgi:hypothetical protein